jgi:N-acyl homoserine lactone hydrolase
MVDSEPALPLEMLALPLGACVCDLATLVPGVQDGTRIHAPVTGYLLRLPDERILLVDSGMSRIHIDDPDATWRGTPNEGELLAEMSPEDSLLHRLAELELAPQDVDYVVNTHLHFDHAGNNDLLSEATFFVQREQYELAQGHPSYPNQYWNLPSLSYELVDGERELFPGVRVVPTPGHVPGHQSVAVDLPETGMVILCGDAIYSQDNLDHDSWGGQSDPVLARESAGRLTGLAAELPAQLFFGHDPRQATSMRWSPSASYR